MTMSSKDRGLAPYATRAEFSRGRMLPERTSASRTPYQRDRDRIVHSSAFRKMRNKTQVFIESEGDYYRTRLTHSLEVAQIARSISRALDLDEDLTEAIALAHDLGHTCFGHAGEDGLDVAMKPYGGFDHNEQTFRVLTLLESKYAGFNGLNLTWETLEGIAKHNGPIGPESLFPTLRTFDAQWSLDLNSFASLEAQVAALSDDIAYNTHDADDGHHAGFFSLEDLSDLPLFGPSLRTFQKQYPNVARERIMYEAVRDVIGVMVNDVIEMTWHNLEKVDPETVDAVHGAGRPIVGFSAEMAKNLSTLHQFLHKRMYRHEKVNKVCDKAKGIVRDLFDLYMKSPNLLPASWGDSFKTLPDETAQARLIADYIAGMTDRFALQEHKRLFSVETVI